MVANFFDPRRFVHFPEWCDVRDRADERTRRAVELVRTGYFAPSDLDPVFHRHPGDRCLFYVEWRIRPDAKPLPWRKRWPLWRALRYLQDIRDRRTATTLDEAVELVRKRFPSTSRQPGFDQAAAIAWRRAGDWIERGMVGVSPWPVPALEDFSLVNDPSSFAG